MFKFLERGATIRSLVFSLSEYSPFKPYDDSNYSYHFKDNVFHVNVNFPYRKEIHQKYTLIYNNELNALNISPNDINMTRGTSVYRKLLKAVKIAYKNSLERDAFYQIVVEERKKMAKFVTNN